MSTRDFGYLGEKIASDYLEKKGFRLLEKNFRSKFGEIDIIAIDQNTLVFVEVKARWSSEFGLPEEAITSWKIRKIIKTADYYQLLHSQLPKLTRIDACAIDLWPSGELKEIRYFENISQ